MKHALARGKPMCALDRRRTRHPPSRLAPTEPASCGHPNKANSGARSDPILGERSSASRLGLASVRAPPCLCSQGWFVSRIKIYFLYQ
jgi:hypothetical protein